MNYDPPKPFFRMNINELKEYINNCKKINKLEKSKKCYKTRKRKMRNRKTRKLIREKHTRDIWLKS